MATQLFLLNTVAESIRGNNDANLIGTNVAWVAKALSQPGTRGSGVVASANTATVAGATPGVEITDGNEAERLEWLSEPVSADVTISGAITGNIWASENNMSANVAINFVVDKVAATDGAITNIVTSARVTEVAVTTRAVNNFTATPGAGVAVNRGDRIRVRIFGDDAGTMASGFTFNIGFNGTTAAADGDTYVQFTETFSFESAPSGTTLYLTDTASDVSTASVDREAWTARGGGVLDDVSNTAAGFTTPLQITDTAGGTVVDWFTKQLAAFTLGGKASANIRAKVSNLLAHASAMVEIAVVDSDGTNPVVWGIGHNDGTVDTGVSGQLNTTETAKTIPVAGDDLSVADGKRLRIRLYADDSRIAMGASQTVTTYYNGTSGGASGDSFVTLAQTVSEFVAGAVSDMTWITDRRTPRRRSMQRW